MPKKLIALWISYRTHHLTKALVECVIGVVLLSLPVVSTAALISSSHHKPLASQPVASKKVNKPKPRAVVVKKKPAPKKSTPVSEKVAIASPPVSKSKPAPIPAAQPAPSGGAKKLTPAPKTKPSSGNSSSSGSSTSSTGGGSSSSSGTNSQTPTFATGGFTSTNWAGYVATAGSYDSISGSWIVPSATGNGSSTTADASWIGIGGVFSSDLIQTGTLNTVSASGQASTFAFYELLPDTALEIPSISVSPGNNMAATINETSAGVWTISISDISTSQTFTTTVNYTSRNSSAEWIEEDPSFANGSLVPFDNFSPAAFTNGAVGVSGVPNSISTAGASPITLVSQAGSPLAKPTILTTDGAGFSVYRQ